MPLPKLETNRYECVLPSTGETIEYRPFLVREEKLLLIAQESEDPKQILKVVKDIINACTFEKVNVNTLTSYDLEFVFLKIRSKSVGETIDLKKECPHCSEVMEFQINIEEVNVSKPEKEVSNTIKITESVGMVLRPLSIKFIDKIDEKDISSSILPLIDNIYDNDNVYKADDTDRKELIDFIDSLSHGTLMEIQEYITNQPKLTHTKTCKCKACNKTSKILLEGLNDFFI